MNRFITLGRLTKDVELKTSRNDKVFANFSIAVNRIFEKDSADFFNCVTFGKSAEYLSKYGSKGSQVLIEGSVQIENKDGKYYTNIICQNVSLVGSRNENQETQQKEKQVQQVKSMVEEDDFEDNFETSEIAVEEDLPF